MSLYRKAYILQLAFLTATIICQAQLHYSSEDSISILQKIENVSKLIVESKSDAAMRLAREALQLSDEKKFLYGKAWAFIKINDILIEREDYDNSEAPPLQIIQIGEQLGNREIIGIGYLQTGRHCMYNNKPVEAEPFFEKAIRLLDDKTDYAALAWNERGYNAGLTSDLQRQTDYLLKALQLYEQQDNESGLAMSYNNLSVLYIDIGDWEKAVDYAKKTIALREKLNDTRGLTFSYCNLSQMYLDKDIKEAEKYSHLCTKAAEKLNDDNRRMHAISTSGLVKDRMGKKSETLPGALQILEILKRNENPSVSLSRQHLAVGIIMSETGMDSITALQHHNQGLEMALALNHKITIRDAYLMKTIFFKQRNDFYNAYENLKRYHAYKDSIINTNTQTNISELQTKYETEKKDNHITRLYSEQKINQLQIEKLNNDKRTKQLEIEKQNAIISGNRLLAKQKENQIALLSKERELLDLQVKQQTQDLERQLLLGKTQEQLLQLAEKEKALNEAAVKRQKQAKQFVIGAALATLLVGGILFNRYQLKKKISEQERLLAVRDNIAKDLHDEVGSALSSIKILSEVSYKNMEKDKDKSTALLKQIVAQSERSQQGISDIVWSIKPDNDKLENITLRMREYMGQTLEPQNIEVKFTVSEDLLQRKLDMQQRKDVLLIFKEAINNMAKYSGCTKADVRIEAQNKSLFFHFVDNGNGFNPDKITSSNGLRNMRARATSLNGSMIINSSPGQGSHLILVIPSA